jgi:hypothetical protein
MSDIAILWKQPKQRLAAIVIGLMVAAGITGAYWAMKMIDTPPIVVLTSRVLNPIIEQGGVLRLYVELTSKENRECDGKVTREFSRLVDVNGRMIPEIWRIAAPAPIVSDGVSSYVVNIPLTLVGDVKIPVGEYEFQGETSYFCGSLFGDSKRYRTTFKNISIVPKGSL